MAGIPSSSDADARGIDDRTICGRRPSDLRADVHVRHARGGGRPGLDRVAASQHHDPSGTRGPPDARSGESSAYSLQGSRPRRRAAHRSDLDRRACSPRATARHPSSRVTRRRQHRRLRLRQPRRPEHAHDHRQLDPQSRSLPAARTSTRSTTTSATRSTSTTTATARATSTTTSGSRSTPRPTNAFGIPTYLYNDGPITSLTTRTGSSRRPTPSRATAAQIALRPAHPAGQRRPALDARTTRPISARRPSTPWRTG